MSAYVNFISSNVALPPLKTDLNPPQGLTYELDAGDVNQVWEALGNIRDHVNGWINPKEAAYGAKMDGATDDGPALLAAAADANSKGFGLYISGKIRVASQSITISVPVYFGGNGSFDLRGGTVTLNGTINAPVRQVFFMNGGTLSVNRNKNRVGFPEWWGASPGGADCLAALQYAVQSLSMVELQQADYFISSTWKINAPSVTIKGAHGIKSVGGSTGGTRLLLTSGTGDVMQIGPDTSPGSINSFLQHVRVQDLELSRTTGCVSAGQSFTAPAGIHFKYTLYTYIDRVWSTENLIGFNLDGTVQTHINESYAFRSIAAASGSDFFWGFALNGDASIGAAGGNASTYLTDCNVAMGGNIGATGGSPITSVGFNLSSAFVDTFLIRPETSNLQIGIEGVGTAGGSAGLQKTGNADLHIISPIIDTFTSWGCYLTSLSNYAALDITNGYFAPASGASSTACIGVTNSGGMVTLANNQCVCWPTPATLGIYLVNSSGINSKGNMISGSQRPIALDTVTFSHIEDVINTPAEGGSEGAVYLVNSSHNFVAPIIKGGAAQFPYGVQLDGTGNTYNEINTTTIDTTAISGGMTNKVVINGVPVRKQGLTRYSNYISGVVTGDLTEITGYINVKDYGAVGDGTTDDTANIQLAIDLNKGKTILIPAGTFICAGLSLADSTYNGTKIVCQGGVLKLKADGGGSTFGGAWVGLLLGTVSNVYLDLVWDGNRSAMTDREQIFCVGIAGSSHVHMPSMVFREIRGDGIYIGQSDWTSSSTNPTDINIGTVLATNTADDGRNAISIISANRVTVGFLHSYQVGGFVATVYQPGGLDIEPDSSRPYHNVSDVVIGGANIVTAGTSGFQAYGRSATSNDAARDWNVKNISTGPIRVIRTGTTGSQLSAINIIRVKNCHLNIVTQFTNAYGKGYQLDYCDGLYGNLEAAHVNFGVHAGPVGSVQDFNIEVRVTDYSTAGIRSSQVVRGRFKGRISNSTSVSASTPFAIQTHNEGGVVTQTAVIYSVDCPYDTVNARAFRNEPSNTVTFDSACRIKGCDFSGYSSFSTMIENSTSSPFKENIAGLDTSLTGGAYPSTGYFNRGEIVSISGTAVLDNTNRAKIGYLRLTTGNTHTQGTDWTAMYTTYLSGATSVSPSNGGTVAPNTQTSEEYLITAANGVASFTVNSPLNPLAGQRMRFCIINSSGGAITVTWDPTGAGGSLGYALAGGAYTAPANGKRRYIEFEYDSNTGKWGQTWASPGDV